MGRRKDLCIHSCQQVGAKASEIRREARCFDLMGQNSIHSPEYKHCNKLCECCRKMRHSTCEDGIEKRNSSEVERNTI